MTGVTRMGVTRMNFKTLIQKLAIGSPLLGFQKTELSFSDGGCALSVGPDSSLLPGVLGLSMCM